MAGLGRRTHYRKHLTDSVLNDLPEPKENECIAKVAANRGGNQFDILLANNSSNSTSSNDDNDNTHLAILPTKFRKLVWVKRNDYVIVEMGDAKTEEEENDTSKDQGGGGVRYMIAHILYKEQIKHLSAKNLWPDDPAFVIGAGAAVDENENENENGIDDEKDDDGIVYNDYDDELDDDLFVNTNRVARLEIQESAGEESSDED